MKVESGIGGILGRDKKWIQIFRYEAWREDTDLEDPDINGKLHLEKYVAYESTE